jgi:hypothetical protein
MYSDQDIANLVARVQQLEGQAMVKQNAAVPNIKLLSPNFLARAFAVWGHFFVANLLISIAVSCLFVILGLVMGASFFSIFQDAIKQFGSGLTG